MDLSKEMSKFDIGKIEEQLQDLTAINDGYNNIEAKIKHWDADCLHSKRNKLTTNCNSSDALNVEVSSLKEEKQNILTKIYENEEKSRDILKNYKKLTQKLNRLDDKIDDAQQRCFTHYKTAIKTDNNDALLNLLENVTSIEWDVENCSADQISGFIVNEDQVQKFTIDCSDNNGQCNKLWDKLRDSEMFLKSINA